MNKETFREFCLSLPGTVENSPWTEPQYEMLRTYTVGDKWFVLEDTDKNFIDVKASPDSISEMQSKYQGAFPAWHMNKEHWLGVRLESDVPDEVIKSLVRQGYDLIVEHLSKQKKENLKGIDNFGK